MPVTHVVKYTPDSRFPNNPNRVSLDLKDYLKNPVNGVLLIMPKPHDLEKVGFSIRFNLGMLSVAASECLLLQINSEDFDKDFLNRVDLDASGLDSNKDYIAIVFPNFSNQQLSSSLQANCSLVLGLLDHLLQNGEYREFVNKVQRDEQLLRSKSYDDALADDTSGDNLDAERLRSNSYRAATELETPAGKISVGPNAWGPLFGISSTNTGAAEVLVPVANPPPPSPTHGGRGARRVHTEI